MVKSSHWSDINKKAVIKWVKHSLWSWLIKCSCRSGGWVLLCRLHFCCWSLLKLCERAQTDPLLSKNVSVDRRARLIESRKHPLNSVGSLKRSPWFRIWKQLMRVGAGETSSRLSGLHLRTSDAGDANYSRKFLFRTCELQTSAHEFSSICWGFCPFYESNFGIDIGFVPGC